MKLNKIYAGLLILSIACITSCEEKKDDNPNPAPQNNEVIMNNDKFLPATLTVTAGTTVKWINRENDIHTVTSDSAGLFDSGDMVMNEVFSYTFNTAGTYHYHCIHHQGMTGRIVVQ